MKRVDARIYALTRYVKLFFIPPWKRSFNFPLVLQNMRLSLRPENLKKFRAVCRPFLISHLLNKRNYSKLLVKTGKKQVDRKKSPNILPLIRFFQLFSTKFDSQSRTIFTIFFSFFFFLCSTSDHQFRGGVYSSHESRFTTAPVVTRAPISNDTWLPLAPPLPPFKRFRSIGHVIYRR